MTENHDIKTVPFINMIKKSARNNKPTNLYGWTHKKKCLIKCTLESSIYIRKTYFSLY
jgi:hypothetical protein